jgi:hypothetical protein
MTNPTVASVLLSISRNAFGRPEPFAGFAGAATALMS